MSSRQVKKSRRVKVPIGDFRQNVDVMQPSIVSGFGGKTKRILKKSFCAKMKVETRQLQASDEQRFNKVNIGKVPTHTFTARYKKAYNTSDMLKFNGDLFVILGVENPENRNEYSVMRARLTGEDDQEASEA